MDIWIDRLEASGKTRALKVDWVGITQRGETRTNYQLLAGDRLFLQKQKPAKTDQERMVGNWFITNDDSMRKGVMWVIYEDRILMYAKNLGLRARTHSHRLDASKTPKQIDIDEHVKGVTTGPIEGIYAFDGDELRICLAALGKDRPTEFASKPGAAELLILQRAAPKGQQDKPAPKNDAKQVTKEEKLRRLIDNVLTAHGGADKLSKLQFTMTVKHSNGETQHYFVQPPKNFRWETTHPDRTSKRIVILFPEGRKWWAKEPNEVARPFLLTGPEPPVEHWFDYVKFFGPRQVLRLKDADHKVTLLDENIRKTLLALFGADVFKAA